MRQGWDGQGPPNLPGPCLSFLPCHRSLRPQPLFP
jgi:hypothetical protein